MDTQLATTSGGKAATCSLHETWLNGLMSENKVDWDGQYVFDARGEVDITATSRKRLTEPMDVTKRPIPKLDEAKRAVAELLLNRIEEALRPGTAKDFAAIFTDLSFHCGMANAESAVRRRVGGDFWYDIGHLPIAVINEACLEWRRSSEERCRFMPRPGDILPSIKSKAAKLHQKAYRLRVLLGRPQPDEVSGVASIYGRMSPPSPLADLLRS